MSGTTVLGIGNRLGGDDAAGAYLVQELHRRLKKAASPPPDITAIDAATAPESYTSIIRRERPALLILVDAADMGLSPGSIRIIPPQKISTSSFSTHQMPLSAFMAYVSEFCEHVVLIGVQPGNAEAGSKISATVRQSTKKLAELILENRITEVLPLE
jgi:hydrogenase 3 maturation protease